MKNLMIKSAVAAVFLVLTMCMADGFGQAKYIELPAGKKLVLKGELPAGRERFYTFEAKPGQTLTARLISANRRAAFSVDAVYNIGPPIVSETVVEGKTSWSGRLPDLNSNQFGIEVSTPSGRAAYRLEITLR